MIGSRLANGQIAISQNKMPPVNFDKNKATIIRHNNENESSGQQLPKYNFIALVKNEKKKFF